MHGTDIYPDRFPPSDENASYEVQDIIDPWPEAWKGRFDLVHQRMVLVGGRAEQIRVLQALGALVKPGGWIQLVEATQVLPEDAGPNLKTLVALMRAVFTSMQANLNMPDLLPTWLTEDGFTDIGHETVWMKLGSANRDPTIGKRGTAATVTGARGLVEFGKSLPPGALGIPMEKLETLGDDLEQELTNIGGLCPPQARVNGAGRRQLHWGHAQVFSNSRGCASEMALVGTARCTARGGVSSIRTTRCSVFLKD
ncbi:hypothetical protein GGR57DRAFT_342294 [Xylariaceae sp. FL1272]|nr:hypothetical protein GGR57DRAFT_342294 [Xylariaceae sp. FL1272]